MRSKITSIISVFFSVSLVVSGCQLFSKKKHKSNAENIQPQAGPSSDGVSQNNDRNPNQNLYFDVQVKSYVKGDQQSETKKIQFSIRKQGASESIYNDQILNLTQKDEIFVSDPISVAPGFYEIVSFCVLNSNNEKKFVVPMNGSAESGSVAQALPLSFEIVSGIENHIKIEVIAAFNITNDKQISSTPVSTSVSTPTQASSPTKDNPSFEISLGVSFYDPVKKMDQSIGATLVITALGEILYKGILLPQVNRISIPDRGMISIYNLKISREGFKDYAKDFSGADLKTLASDPLKVNLELLQQDLNTINLVILNKPENSAYVGLKVFGSLDNINEKVRVDDLSQTPLFRNLKSVVGPVIDISSSTKFENAEISFKITEGALVQKRLEDFVILRFDEIQHTLTKAPVKMDVANHTISTVTAHFSTYFAVYAKPVKIVQLGDSYSAGPGADSEWFQMEYVQPGETKPAKNLFDIRQPHGCLNSRRNWGYLYAEKISSLFGLKGLDLSFETHACSGSITAEIESHKQVANLATYDIDETFKTEVEAVNAAIKYNDPAFWPKDLAPLPLTGRICRVKTIEGMIEIESQRSYTVTCTETVKSQLLSTPEDADLILMTMGGNDESMFAGIIAGCFLGLPMFGTCDEVLEKGKVLLGLGGTGTHKLRDDLKNAMVKIGEKASRSKIVFINYPFMDRNPKNYSVIEVPTWVLNSIYPSFFWLPYTPVPYNYRGSDIKNLQISMDEEQREAVRLANNELYLKRGNTGPLEQIVFLNVKNIFGGHEACPPAITTNTEECTQQFLRNPTEAQMVGGAANAMFLSRTKDGGGQFRWYHPTPEGHEAIAQLLFENQVFLPLNAKFRGVVVDADDPARYIAASIRVYSINTPFPAAVVSSKNDGTPFEVDVSAGLYSGQTYYFEILADGYETSIHEGTTWAGYGYDYTFRLQKIKNIPMDTVGREIKMYIDSKEYYLDGQRKTMDTVPFIMGTKKYVPLRYAISGLGGATLWDQTTQEAKASMYNQMAVFYPDDPLVSPASARGSNIVNVAGRPRPMDISPDVRSVRRDQRTMVPADTLSDIFGFDASWDENAKEITIRKYGAHRGEIQFGLTGRKAVAISSKGLYTCALMDNGAVRCWGTILDSNYEAHTFVTPTAIGQVAGAVAIANGDGHACALIADGTVKCWGNGGLGQLGNRSASSNFTSAVQVEGIRDAIKIASGWFHSCAILKDKTVKCWGHVDLQNNTSGIPFTLENAKDVDSLFLGDDIICYLPSSQPLECRGYTLSVVSDFPMNDLADAVSISLMDNYFRYYCATLKDGTVKCWGDNNYCQLGNVTIDPAQFFSPCFGSSGISPCRNETRPVTAISISDPIAMATSINANCALIQSGKVNCWGSNRYGLLGVPADRTPKFNNTFLETGSCLPVEVENVSQAISIAGGYYHYCALIFDGTVKCWGSNGWGQMGTGNMSTNVVYIPVSVNF
ncbi:MAG: hypothetical protein HQK54_05725 [Oligoflexales bacterium]|nr:hypothetical protein [Oligoflexales bacterium]